MSSGYLPGHGPRGQFGDGFEIERVCRLRRHQRDESFQRVASWEVDSVGHEYSLERLLGRLLSMKASGPVHACRGVDHNVGDSEVVFGFGQPSRCLCW
jgi:hypothetical protein